VTSTNGGHRQHGNREPFGCHAAVDHQGLGALSIGLADSTSLSSPITNSNAAVALSGLGLYGRVAGRLGGCLHQRSHWSLWAAVPLRPTPVRKASSLTGGTIAASSSCISFRQRHRYGCRRFKSNTTGNVTSANAGTGNTATASINVLVSDLTIVKSHAGNFFQGQNRRAAYTLAVKKRWSGSNSWHGDGYRAPPAGLSPTAAFRNGMELQCEYAHVYALRALAPAASYPAITFTVSVAANAPSSVLNSAR